jgi:hypothetical protein
MKNILDIFKTSSVSKETRIRNEQWIGVDLDGTLAHYDGWVSIYHIGEPIQPMVLRVRGWIERGHRVKIFTARVTEYPGQEERIVGIRDIIEDWCEIHIGHRLEVTNVKDFGMVELWDDRAIRVAENTGHPCCNYKKGEK